MKVQLIRRANHDDARPLSILAESTFRQAFGSANTLENMTNHCRAKYSESIQALEISDPKSLTLLAECENKLIGFAQIRWRGAPSFVRGEVPSEIQRFYVLSEWHGKDVATNLIKACFDEIKTRGSDLVWLGVWERNARAIAFYKKLGFIEQGEQVFNLGSDPQRDIVMARML
jgi:diamine N-acetyltransferase